MVVSPHPDGTMVRPRATLLVLAVLWFARGAVANDNTSATGNVAGTAFLGDSDHQSYVAGAKVIASGPVRIETETNVDGKYAFVSVPPGKYTVEASVSCL
jgi:hypothetical protein